MTRRGALFGSPVAHSRSPGIYRAFAAVDGRDFEFELIDCAPAAFAGTVAAFARRDGAVGANVTIPHKLAAHALCTARSARADLAGAVNLLRFDAAGPYGDNTDGAGLVADLRRLGIAVTGCRVLVVGAGGAARGIIGPLLAERPAALVVANRTAAHAAGLAAHFSVAHAPLSDPGRDFALVLNATSASLAGECPALPPHAVAGAVAYDLAYADAGRTPFTAWAAGAGSVAVHDGWGMLVEQAAESWAVWFGARPAAAVLPGHRVE